MHFHPLKNSIFFLKNIKFDFQTYFNMNNTFNGRISILNLKMEDTTQITKIFYIS
jgi:hypothetical protein